jgi:RNA polymerase sigma-70 factor (ECF subfamily)
MIRFQSGDRSAFTLLVRKHQGPLFNFALRHLRNQPSAEEVVQDAFIRVVQNAADFKHEARFSTWLYTIAKPLHRPDPQARAAAASLPRRTQAVGGE